MSRLPPSEPPRRPSAPSDKRRDANTGKTGTGRDSNTGPALRGIAGRRSASFRRHRIDDESTGERPCRSSRCAGDCAGAPSPQPRWKWPGLWIGLGVSGGMLLLGAAHWGSPLRPALLSFAA